MQLRTGKLATAILSNYTTRTVSNNPRLFLGIILLTWINLITLQISGYISWICSREPIFAFYPYTIRIQLTNRVIKGVILWRHIFIHLRQRIPTSPPTYHRAVKTSSIIVCPFDFLFSAKLPIPENNQPDIHISQNRNEYPIVLSVVVPALSK